MQCHVNGSTRSSPEEFFKHFQMSTQLFTELVSVNN